MRGNRHGLYICLIAFAGAACQPEPQRVWVDIDAVLAGEAQAAPEAISSPAAPQGVPAVRDELAPLAGRAVGLPLTRKRIEAAKQLVKDSDEAAFETLEQHLTAAAIDEVLRVNNRRLEDLRPLLAKARANARQKAHEAFVSSAGKRSYAMLQLALLVGLPDPDPYSLRDTEPGSLRGRRRLETAKAWREIVRTIDADLDDDVRRFDAEAMDTYYKAVAQFYDELDQAKQKAQIEAHNTAIAQRPKPVGGTDSLVADGSQARLRPERGTVVALRQGSAPQAGPSLGSTGRPTAGEQRAKLEADLSIWLAARGYVKSVSKRSARDATEEFLKWRKEQQAGL